MNPLALEDFARAARAFCASLEEPRTTSELVAGLAGLVARAEGLPDAEPEHDAPEAPARESWTPTAAPVDSYWVALHPFEPDPSDLGLGSLLDDLADIRGDLLDGLWLYDRGFTNAACWAWRSSYRAHWGAHAAGALWALAQRRSRG